MKSKEELALLKKEIETLNGKLAELSEDELEQVTGGIELPKGVIPILFAEKKGLVPIPYFNNTERIKIDDSTGSDE